MRKNLELNREMFCWNIDGQVIEGVFDYQFYVESEELLVVIRKPDGEEWELEIEKDI